MDHEEDTKIETFQLTGQALADVLAISKWMSEGEARDEEIGRIARELRKELAELTAKCKAEKARAIEIFKAAFPEQAARQVCQQFNLEMGTLTLGCDHSHETDAIADMIRAVFGARGVAILDDALNAMPKPKEH